ISPPISPPGSPSDTAGQAGADGIRGAWQPHHARFYYYGVTVSYTCEALEDQVRRILLYLGARGDLTISARGCARGPDRPSHNAWVETDFYAPAPAADGRATGNAAAQWARIELTPHHPGFMGNGDCELVQDMKDLVVNNFNARDLAYTTDCFPHELSIDGFAVKGQTLKMTAPTSG
ncbi:MAG: hypothetical protein ABSH33_15505, partial [Steroidobacteraceae bacterium]